MTWHSHDHVGLLRCCYSSPIHKFRTLENLRALGGPKSHLMTCPSDSKRKKIPRHFEVNPRNMKKSWINLEMDE